MLCLCAGLPALTKSHNPMGGSRNGSGSQERCESREISRRATPSDRERAGPLGAAGSGWQRRLGTVKVGGDKRPCGGMVMAAASTTAIVAWDKRWATAEGRADWLDPEADVIALLPELKARGARTALDLGCGVGRHALLLAEHGLAVEAIDGSAPASRSCARPHGPAAYRWGCVKERPMRCRSTIAASILCCRGT